MAVCAFSVGFMEEQYKKVASKYNTDTQSGTTYYVKEI
jgi:hypothetical protein